MAPFPPESADVVRIASRQTEGDRRAFRFDGDPPDAADELPDLDAIHHESDLVAAMKEHGYRLTMVGGGAGGDELRRFYFRRRSG